MKKTYPQMLASWFSHSLLFLLLWLCSTQFVQAQHMCTTQNQPDPLRGTSPNSYRATNACYTVRVFFHFVRTTNGSGGQPVSALPSFMRQLTDYFTPHNIFIKNTGYDEIHDDQYAIGMTNTKYDYPRQDQLTSTQLMSDAVNIYLLDDNSSFQGGLAVYSNTRTTLIIGGNDPSYGPIEYYANSPVLAHEVGHCLGLFHTFESYFYGYEVASGRDCDTKGDLVCDTPAESEQYAHTDRDCVFPTTYLDIYGNPENPDTRNIMDYISTRCMDHFTIGQGDRMRAVIADALQYRPTESLAQTVDTTPIPTPGPISGYYTPGVGALDVSIDPIPNALYYNWYKNGQQSAGHGYNNTWWGPRNECGSPMVEVEAVFTCGTSPRTSRTFPGLTTGCQGPETERTASTTAYPNPATETIQLPAGMSEATLLNAKGMPVRQAGKASSINVQDLPQGLYNLQMWQDGKLINQHIQVTH